MQGLVKACLKLVYETSRKETCLDEVGAKWVLRYLKEGLEPKQVLNKPTNKP